MVFNALTLGSDDFQQTRLWYFIGYTQLCYMNAFILINTQTFKYASAKVCLEIYFRVGNVLAVDPSSKYNQSLCFS